MELFKNKSKSGIMDEIRCDESSYLIWKWHSVGTISGEHSRENALRWGSSLRVKDGEVAVFVYTQNNGVVQDYILGPYDGIIETYNFPVFSSILGKAYGGGTPFQAEIYFINLAQIVQVRFGVPYFDVYDPRFPDFGVPVAVRGTISFRISDYQEFIKLHRLSSFSVDDFQRQIRDAVNRYVKDVVANAPAEHNIPVVQIESKISQINDIIEFNISERLKEDFGVVVSGVDIAAIEIDKSCEDYQKLMCVTRDMSTSVVKAETEAKVKDIAAKQRIEAENYAENLRIQREEGQYAQHKATQTANMGAFQVEKQAEVGIAGASALGQAGENGIVDVNLGGGGGFNLGAVMASMTVGEAVGQNIAGTMNNMMNNAVQPVQDTQTPPPIPTSEIYHVAINGQAAGPYDIAALAQMVGVGQLTTDSLVWKSGMAQWEKAGAVDDLKNLFAAVPPLLP